MYVGIDVHKRHCHATVMNGQGAVVSSGTFPTDLGALTAWAQRLPKGAQLALEAARWPRGSAGISREWGSTRRWSTLSRSVEGPEPRRRRTPKKATNSPTCSECTGFRRAMSRPPNSTRGGSSSLPLRLGGKSQLIKSQVHALLIHNGITSQMTDSSGMEGATRYGKGHRQTSRDPALPAGIVGYKINLLGRQMREIEGQLVKPEQKDIAVHKLLTLPGVDFYSAQ